MRFPRAGLVSTRPARGSNRPMRTMYALYWFVIVGGLTLFWVVGLTVK
jgi:hypothetical protein